MKKKTLHFDNVCLKHKIAIILLLLFTGVFAVVGQGIVHITTTSTNPINVYKWNPATPAWPGTNLVAAAVVLDNPNGGGFYTHTINPQNNYIINNVTGGVGQKTGDLTISQDTWGVYNGTTTFTVLMRTNTMSTITMKFESDVIETGSVTASYNSSKKVFEALVTFTSNEAGINIVIGTTKFLFKTLNSINGYSNQFLGKQAKLVFDPYTGGLTLSSKPIISTVSVEEVGATKATAKAEILSNGGQDIIEYGFYYSTDIDFSESSKVLVGTTNLIDKFSQFLVGLIPNTIYYLKAYAKNSVGEVLSEADTFTTGDCTDAEVSFAQTVSIFACGNKEIDLLEGLSASFPSGSGALTFSVSPLQDVILEGSTILFNGNQSRTYTVIVSTENASFCEVAGNLIVNFTDNTPSFNLINKKSGKSETATYPYENFVLEVSALQPSNANLTWHLEQTGVTKGRLYVAQDKKSATFVSGEVSVAPNSYTIVVEGESVGNCAAPKINYQVAVEAPVEDCSPGANASCTEGWRYRFASDAVFGNWSTYEMLNCRGNKVWMATFELNGSKYNWNAKVWYSPTSSGSWTDGGTFTLNSKGISSYSGTKTWTIIVTEGNTVSSFSISIVEGDKTQEVTIVKPVLYLTAMPNVNDLTAEIEFEGYLRKKGCDNISEIGFEYASDASFTNATKIPLSHVNVNIGDTYTKIVDVSSLDCNNVYFYRAYAINSLGTGYSEDDTFNPPCVSSVSQVLPTNIKLSIVENILHIQSYDVILKQLRITDLSGKKVQDNQLDSSTNTIPLSLNKGLYVLAIETENGTLSYKIWVK